ncbi:alpha-ketoglutarate-dependent dioxygenase AlkB [Martelella radicis]|uniref:Alkylated DNA repair dioxygenase AlkB n=1 Tax=Martelella radicis TaxID=1397476 RepID=A0A7W6PB31_9HYPH|nr:alpha-ketoglutarate-dependent dioxygenase AlkB [Martelella radicis]MBB4123475.1 alkylated DNA repair dioxygenase AlkB [Martelella radicis]
MNTLFDMGDDLPPGAAILPEFVAPSEEVALAQALDALAWSTELKRRVQHFGYRYDYKARAVTPDAYIGPLPDWLDDVTEKLQVVFGEKPDQVIANEYLPGQGISAHIDCPPCFGETIVSLSLLSSCEMIFRRGEAKRAVLLDPRSALIMQGSARYDWTHEIPARKSDSVAGAKISRQRRISLTFRRTIRVA